MRAGPAVLFLPSRFFGGWPEDSFFNDPWPCSSTLVPDESPISPSPPPFTSLLLRSPMGLTATLTENQLAPPTSEGIVPAEGVRDHPSFGGASLRLCVFVSGHGLHRFAARDTGSVRWPANTLGR